LSGNATPRVIYCSPRLGAFGIIVAMEMFRCASCDTVLSTSVSEVPLSHRDTSPPQHEERCPPRMGYGTYAIDPEPFGPPWWRLDEEEFGHRRPGGPRDTYVLAPANVRNTRLIIDKCETGCLGLNGAAGPNLACVSCGAEVATRIDDCGAWQEVRLDPAAVISSGAPAVGADITEPFQWDAAENERLGTAPPDGSRDPDWLWFGTVAACAAKVLARSGGGPIFLAEGSCDLIRAFLASALKGTGHVPRRLPSISTRTPEEWRTAATTAGLTTAVQAATERPVVICDLTGPNRAFTPVHPLLSQWSAAEHGGIRFVGVVPEPANGPEDRQWSQDARWSRQLPPSAIRSVPLDAKIWSYLAHDQARTVRSLARTHWRHNGLAAIAHRDEPPHQTTGVAAEARFYIDRFLRCLVEQPGSHEPWLRTLIGELSHHRW
jgi:hypothetical protein